MAQKSTLGYDERLKRCKYLRVLEVGDVAVMLNISENRLRHLMTEKAIPYYTNQLGKVSFLKDEIEQWRLGSKVMTEAELQTSAVTHIAISNLH